MVAGRQGPFSDQRTAIPHGIAELRADGRPVHGDGTACASHRAHFSEGDTNVQIPRKGTQGDRFLHAPNWESGWDEHWSEVQFFPKGTHGDEGDKYFACSLSWLAGNGVSMGRIVRRTRATSAASSFKTRSCFGAHAIRVAYSACQPSTSTDQFQQRFLATERLPRLARMATSASRQTEIAFGSGTAAEKPPAEPGAAEPPPPVVRPKLVRQRL
jgi:hypothetical protein